MQILAARSPVAAFLMEKHMNEITIFDEIGMGQLTAKSVNDAVSAMGSIDELLVRINSPGGDVNDGIGIYTILKNHPAKIICRIEGIAASAASLIAMAADHIEMSEGTFMLVHEPQMMMSGTSEELEAGAADLEIMTASFVKIYSTRSGMKPEAVLALMKEDRLMSAEEAVKLGFADKVLTSEKAKFNMKRLPARLSAAVRMAKRKGKANMAEENKELEARMDELTEKVDALLARAEEDDETKEQAKSKAKGRKGRADDDNDVDADDDDADAYADDDLDEANAVDDDDDDASADENDDNKPDAEGRAGKMKASRRSGFRRGVAYAKSISEICALAGVPERAMKFIADETPIKMVRKTLLKEASANPTGRIRTAQAYGMPLNGKQSDADVEKGWANTIKSTFSNTRSKR